MTSSFLSYARKAALAAALAALAAGCGSSDPAKHFAAGEAAFSAGDYKKAAVHFRKCAEKAPGGVDAPVMLARCALALGELDEAADVLAKVPSGNASDADVLLLKAQVAFLRKDYALSRELYAKVADDEKADAEFRAAGWAGTGVVDYFLVDRPGSGQETRDRARTELLRATQIDKRNALARYYLGRLYADSYHFVEAAEEQFKQFAYLETESPDRVRRVQRETIPALREEKARKAASRPGASRRDAVACTKALAKADELFRKGAYADARAAYADALNKDALSCPAALGLARSAERSARTAADRKAAYRAYCQACELDPTDTKTLITAADLAMKVESWASAANLYSKAMAMKPANTTAIDGLIRALRKCGDSKAAAIYQRYRDTLPKRG